MRDGRQIGAVGFDDDPVFGHPANDLAHVFRRLEGGDAGNGEPGAKFRCCFSQFQTASVAVHQQLERSLGVFLAQDRRHDVVGFAGMHHQRQASPARSVDVLAEDRRLLVTRAEVVVKIQAALADADDARALGQSHQFVSGQLVSDKLVLKRRGGANPYTFPTSLKSQTGDVGDKGEKGDTVAPGAQGAPPTTVEVYAERVWVDNITPGVVETQFVTFPAGRFSTPPSVMVTVGGATKAFASHSASNGATSCTIAVLTETATTIDVHLIAMSE